ncbi:MAG TPA: hypothetical protein P5277_02420 [Candidatus Paceibacterota bacterium]|nr:hypothetical protein [Candidatus Paceibacterota bacterium]
MVKIKNKRGLSEIVSYVLLILIAIIIAGFVWYWVSTLTPKCKLECPDDLGLTVDWYGCHQSSGSEVTKYVSMIVRLTGFSEVDGLNVKFAKTETGGAVYTLRGRGPTGQVLPMSQNGSFYFTSPMGQNEELNITFDYTSLGNIKKVQIIPVYYNTKCEDKKLEYALCSKNMLIQPIEGCS